MGAETQRGEALAALDASLQQAETWGSGQMAAGSWQQKETNKTDENDQELQGTDGVPKGV
jgi:hypothetical protein